MQVCFFRHAARNPFDAGDGSLSDRGQEQAQALSSLISPRGPLPRPTHLLCSPKLRARQTFAPLGEDLGLNVTITEALDERGDKESMTQFIDRIDAWLEALAPKYGAEDVIFACSHLDVLEEVMGLIPTDLPDWETSRGFSPAEYRWFEISDGLYKSKSRKAAADGNL